MIETALFAFLSVTAAATPGVRIKAAAEHGDIVDAIEARDERAAAAAMLRAIDTGHAYVKQTHCERAKSRAR